MDCTQGLAGAGTVIGYCAVQGLVEATSHVWRKCLVLTRLMWMLSWCQSIVASASLSCTEQRLLPKGSFGTLRSMQKNCNCQRGSPCSQPSFFSKVVWLALLCASPACHCNALMGCEYSQIATARYAAAAASTNGWSGPNSDSIHRQKRNDCQHTTANTAVLSSTMPNMGTEMDSGYTVSGCCGRSSGRPAPERGVEAHCGGCVHGRVSGLKQGRIMGAHQLAH